ncbi:hypothetical protein WR25_21982 [Diploscapter pachys]|uniref:AB hydrolase-1 domain-containing protein n=1 Tax=Diploscapter pachys TaxID=2018661 RepID=A0A2A2L9G5_9BILA|nr:hypothetical protein WR25_21982 [Diploscapter pachys]
MADASVLEKNEDTQNVQDHVDESIYPTSSTTNKGFLQYFFSWGSPNEGKLIAAEKRMMSSSGITDYKSKFVKARFKSSEIYTMTVECKAEDKEPDPIVLMHGFGTGSAIWCNNFHELAAKHDVHAFDLLGFGRSARPNFSSDGTLAELELVETIEDWRKEMGIDKMYLVGHSFGAYIASSYALEHPAHVKYLILADAWGFPEKILPTEKQISPYPWMIFLGSVLAYFNPFTVLRLAGPYARHAMKILRPDMQERFRSERRSDIYDYLYECNALNPTGETAFMSMCLPYGWAKRPMIRRFNGIDENIPATFIFGSKSWVDPGPAFDIQMLRNDVDVQIVRGAGHHIYADMPEEFNRIVLEATNYSPESHNNDDKEQQ